MLILGRDTGWGVCVCVCVCEGMQCHGVSLV